MSEEPPKKITRKPRTQGNREGRPYQRSSDGKWVAVVYLPNGKRKPVYGNTRKEALEKKKRVERELAEQAPVTIGRGPTLADYLEKMWLPVTLQQRVQAGRLAPSTFDSYREKCELHIIPHLGKVKLAELSPAHLRTWLLELQRKPSGKTPPKPRPGKGKPARPTLSARTVAYCHAVLRKALEDALRDELVKRNVAKLVDPPAVERREMEPLTQEEVSKLLAAASEHRLWCYWLVVLALGLRRGEGLGLRWSDVDLDAGTVRIRASVQRIREIDPETGRRKGRLVINGLKTEASQATLRLPASVAEALREHRLQQEAERAQAPMWADKELVFATRVGTPLEPRNVNRAWESICRAAGVRQCRIHDLRHACGTFLYAKGVDLKVIQGVLRHTRLATTSEIYVHLLEEVRGGAADTMDAVLVDLTAERERRRAAG